jgi:hypothetical protein
MSFAICRIQKIKSWGQLKAHEAHTSRMRATPNANPEVENIQVAGNFDNLDLMTLVQHKIGQQKIRSNAVIAVEMLLSASAEYFRPHAPHLGGVYDKQRLNNFVDAVVKWLNQSWSDRIIKAELHLDEITPHIHAYLVPLDERGKLNCKALFGTRVKMYDLQDSFAAAVAHLGILRGIKGSVATHQKIRKYYAAVNQDSQVLDLEQCLPQPQPQETGESYRQKVIDVLSPQLELINYQLLERSSILQQTADLKQTAYRSEQMRQQLARELKILQAITNQQDLPLSLVAEELGLNPNKQFHDKAIDLVMGVNQCNFDNALVWLRDRFGENAMLNAVVNHCLTIVRQVQPLEFIPPTESCNHWQEIEHYLTRKRFIPEKLVQTLYQHSLVYADATGNAVFLARNLLNEPKGAYLHKPGTGNTFNLYPTSKRDCSWFHLSMGGNRSEPTTQAMLVSSPIEALSLAVLNAPHKCKTLYLVTDRLCCQLPVEFLKKVRNVIVATNRESAFSIHKVLSNAILPPGVANAITLEPKTTWNRQLQERQGGKSYATLER